MSVFFEGNAYIDAGVVTNSDITNSSIGNSAIDMNLKNITSVLDPIQAQDAATKNYVDILDIKIFNITLTNTTPTVISSNLSGSYVIKVHNNVLNGPSAIFNVSKSENTNYAHIVRITGTPGLNTSTFLLLTWNPNEGIKLYKTTSSYDGSYTIKIM